MAVTTTVNVGQSPVLIYGSRGDPNPITILNTDSSVTVWIGNVSNITVAGSNVMPLTPGSSIVMDGTVSVYAIASQTAVIAVSPGSNSLSPGSVVIDGPVTATIDGPVEISSITDPVNIASVNAPIDINDIAGQVNIFGKGGYVSQGQQSVTMPFTPGTAIAPSGAQTSAGIDFTTNTSFNLSVSIYAPSQGTSGAVYCCNVIIYWYADSALTQPLGTESFWIWACYDTSGLPASISGPTQGGYAVISLVNYGSAGTMYIETCTVYCNNITLPGLKGFQSAPTSNQINLSLAGHYTSPNTPSGGSDGILCNIEGSSSFSASTTYIVPCPLYFGPIQAYVYFTNAGFTAQPTLYYLANNGPALSVTPKPSVIWNGGNTAGTTYFSGPLTTPRCPMYWAFTLSATAAKDVSLQTLASPN